MTNTPGLYGVVELDANLKNTIESLERAKNELKKLTKLDIDYKMPGLAAFRSDTEQMIGLLHNVERKVGRALEERQNESQIIMNSDAEIRSSVAASVSSSSQSTKSTATTSTNTTKKRKKTRSSKTDKVSHYDVELKIKMIPK